jgi:hypothetical protein
MELSGMITSLLNHYWVADDLLPVREAQVRDWIEDLAAFDLDIVRNAIAEWRRKPHVRRPTPGDVRSLAFAAQQDRRDQQRCLEDKTAQQAGPRWEPWLYDLWGPASTGIDARNAAIAQQNQRYARAEQWRCDNPNWAEKKPPITARDLGVTVTEHRSPLASYPDDPT